MRTKISALIYGIAFGAIGFGAAETRAQYRRYYFDQPVPLGLAPDRIAVFSRIDAGGGVAAASRPDLSKHGLASESIHPHNLPGVSLAGVPDDLRNAAGVRTLVRMVAQDDAIAFVSPVFIDEYGHPLLITREMAVRFGDDVTPAEAEDVLTAQGAGTIKARNWGQNPGVYVLKAESRDGFDVLETANTLAKRPDVIFAEPNMILTGWRIFLPNDPDLLLSWGVHNVGQSGGVEDMDMDGPEAWDVMTGAPAILTVVLDDGIDQNHPELNQVPGADFTGNNSGGDHVNACDAHGTWVAGTIASIIDNGVGTAGIAPDTRVVSAKVFLADPPDENGNCGVTGSIPAGAIVNALSFAQSIGARVTNTSLGFPSSSAITEAYFNAREAGITHFAAAGNNGTDSIGHPASLNSVNAVAALTRTGDRASFSQYGVGLAFSAPGQSIYTTDPVGSPGFSGDFATVSGTSFASPYAAGVAALTLSADPSLRPSEIEDIMAAGAVDLGPAGPDTDFGAGFVNAHNSVRQIAGTVAACRINEIAAAPPVGGAAFGGAVALRGDAAVVGARLEGCDPDSQCGAAYVLRWDGSAWIQEQRLTASDAAALDHFGTDVVVDADRLLAGAPSAALLGTISGAGAVYAYDFDGSTWGNEQKLAADDGQENAAFGTAVALSGSTAVIGAVDHDDRGAAYVFTHDGTSWSQQQQLLAGDGATGDDFGHDVAIDGNVIVVGAPQVDCVDGTLCGAAYVFRFDGATWVEEQKLMAVDADATDRFGFSVGLSGDTILVGAPLDECSAGASCGSAYVFEFDGSSWTQVTKVAAPDADAADLFGFSVSLSGSTGLIGAYANDCANDSNCGSAYTFLHDPIDGWFVDGKLIPADAASLDSFGWSVAVDGRLGLVGARSRDVGSDADAGAVFSFGVGSDCNDNGVADACDVLRGFSEDLDGNGEPDECICPPSSAPTTDTLGTKNRFLTVQAGDPGASQAIRVKFIDLPGSYAAFNGEVMWLGPPQAVAENSGQVTPDPPDAPSFMASALQCDPHYRDWSTFPAVQVHHELIVPNGTYELQVIDEVCVTTIEDNFSAALLLDTTPRWADLVENCAIAPCPPPNGVVDVQDVLAALNKFQNMPGAPIKARVDLEPAVVNFVIDIGDILRILDAFSGASYPFAPPGVPCG